MTIEALSSAHFKAYTLKTQGLNGGNGDSIKANDVILDSSSLGKLFDHFLSTLNSSGVPEKILNTSSASDNDSFERIIAIKNLDPKDYRYSFSPAAIFKVRVHSTGKKTSCHISYGLGKQGYIDGVREKQTVFDEDSTTIKENKLLRASELNEMFNSFLEKSWDQINGWIVNYEQRLVDGFQESAQIPTPLAIKLIADSPAVEFPVGSESWDKSDALGFLEAGELRVIKAGTGFLIVPM